MIKTLQQYYDSNSEVYTNILTAITNASFAYGNHISWTYEQENESQPARVVVTRPEPTFSAGGGEPLIPGSPTGNPMGHVDDGYYKRLSVDYYLCKIAIVFLGRPNYMGEGSLPHFTGGIVYLPYDPLMKTIIDSVYPATPIGVVTPLEDIHSKILNYGKLITKYIIENFISGVSIDMHGAKVTVAGGREIVPEDALLISLPPLEDVLRNNIEMEDHLTYQYTEFADMLNALTENSNETSINNAINAYFNKIEHISNVISGSFVFPSTETSTV